MRSSFWIASVLATVVLGAPTYDAWTVPAGPQDTAAINIYFQTLASKVDETRKMSSGPVCDLTKAQQPVAPIPLPTPAAGLVLKHVAIGRGTQNYTCVNNTAQAIPAAFGAVATLYNVSCIASCAPELLANLPNFALQYNLNSANPSAANPANLVISGNHYFPATTTPFFNLDTQNMQLGQAPCSKVNATAAPASASPGQGGKGNGAVAWLKLVTKDGATGNLQEVYRLNTAGGAAPANCAGMPATFEIQYAAEYWFYRK